MGKVHHDGIDLVLKISREQIKIITRQALLMTKASLKSRYRSTWGGFVWVLLFPILIYTAQSYAFHYILKIQMPNYLLFLLSGLIPWIFISSSVEMATGCYVNSGQLLKSMPIHPLSILFSQVADNFLNYFIAFILLLFPVALLTSFDLGKLIYFLPAFLSLGIFVIGFSHLLATLNVFFRDVRFIISFFMQISFFLTPIFYPLSLVPEQLQWYVSINPFVRLISPFQIAATQSDMTSYWFALLMSYFVSIATVLISIYYWSRKKNDIYYRF